MTVFNCSVVDTRHGTDIVPAAHVASGHRQVLHGGILAIKRETILKTVWGNDSYANSLALNVQITYIRKALASDPTIAIVSLKKRGIVMEVK